MSFIKSPYKFFLLLYAFIGLFPYLGGVDKTLSQNLYLNLLNLIVIIYFLLKSRKKFLEKINNSIASLPFICLFFFLVWSSITAITSINLSEAIQALTERYVLHFSFILIYFLIINIKNYKQFFYHLILITLLMDLISVFYPYFKDIVNEGSPSVRGNFYRGYSGNINIMAFILAFKYIIISYYTLKANSLKKTSLIILNAFTVFAIFVIFQTRSAIVATLFSSLLMFFLINYVFYKRKIFSYKSLKNQLISIFIPIIITLSVDAILSSRYNAISVQDRVSTLNNLESDQSLAQRLRYYKAALESFIKFPVLGVGIGNWEVESVKYENPHMKNFVVPYHAHNDFLELLAETGLIGMTLFYFPILWILFLLIKKALKDRTLVKENDIIFLIFLSVAIIVYLLDSSFNFPFDRTFQQIFLLILLSTSMRYINLKPLFKNKRIKYLIISIIILYPLTTYSSIRLLLSSQQQRTLLRQFNADDYSYPSIEEITSYETEYLNMTPTALPINTIIGMYYLRNSMYKESIPYFKKGIDVSPHLYLSESMLSYAYGNLGQLDSAYHYADIAIKNVPNNPLFYANYAYAAIQKNDSIGIKNVYNNLDERYKDDSHEEIYLMSLNSILKDDKKSFALTDFQFDMRSDNDKLKKVFYSLKFGRENVEEADRLYNNAIEFFEQEDYKRAAPLFEQAANLNNDEYAYRENAANAYLQIGDYVKSLELLNELIDVYNYTTPKTYYLRALTLFYLEMKDSACIDLKKVDESGYLGDSDIYNSFCRN